MRWNKAKNAKSLETICEELMNQTVLIRNSKLKIANGNHSTLNIAHSA